MTESRTRWTEMEWYEVVKETMALRQRQPGVGWGTAAGIAQKKVLAKSRRRPEGSLTGGARAQLEEMGQRIAAGWAPEGVIVEAAPVPAPAPAMRKAPPPEDVGRNRQAKADQALEARFTSTAGRIFWTRTEWAMMACAVKHKQANGDGRSLSRLFFETQADVLPLDRCRKLANLYGANAALQSGYEEGLRHVWELPADVQAKLTGREAEYAAHLEKTRAGLEAVNTPPAPAPLPIEAPAPALAPLPSLAGDPLAVSIAGILSEAGSRIAAETRAHVMAEYDRQLDRLVEALGGTLRQYVHTLLEAELGPLAGTHAPILAAPSPSPSAPPADEPPPAPAPAPDDEAAAAPPPPAQRLQVHIVGQGGPGRGMIRETARVLGIDADFIDPERALRQWFPAPHVIMTTKDGRLRKGGASGRRVHPISPLPGRHPLPACLNPFRNMAGPCNDPRAPDQW